MPEHKNQHYVPRCHLKPFSLNGEGTAINLFNIARSRAIRNAPVKGQCARDYLYGVDLELEKALQFIEGEYARIIRIIQTPAGNPSVQELELLRGFAFLQYQRTEMAAQRTRNVHEGLHKLIYEGRPVRNAPDLDVSPRAMMVATLQTYARAHKVVDDLKVCIVRNGTPTDFVTSDDPSVLTNKYHAQRLRTNNFGIGSSGALFVLPLTPRHCLICYDGDVHTIPQKQGRFVSITDPADALAINELQYLKAGANVYFSQWDDRNRIAQAFDLVRPRRTERSCAFSVFVPDGVAEAVAVVGDKVEVRERYRRATHEERRTADETMVSFANLHPVPSRWLSKLKYRDPVRTYGNGSAAGQVRKAIWEEWERERPAARRRPLSVPVRLTGKPNRNG